MQPLHVYKRQLRETTGRFFELCSEGLSDTYERGMHEKALQDAEAIRKAGFDVGVRGRIFKKLTVRLERVHLSPVLVYFK